MADNKKIDRLVRQRHLTAEEIARDDEVRRQVQGEFPPAATSPGALGQLSQPLREILRNSEKPLEQIAQEAGVSPLLLSRFLSGERDIHMATADKLAAALGLKLASAP